MRSSRSTLETTTAAIDVQTVLSVTHPGAEDPQPAAGNRQLRESFISSESRKPAISSPFPNLLILTPGRGQIRKSGCRFGARPREFGSLATPQWKTGGRPLPALRLPLLRDGRLPCMGRDSVSGQLQHLRRGAC